MIELLNPIILFALVFFGLALRGLLEVRLERRHADVLHDLGGGLILVPPAAPSGRREWAWAKFMTWKHFRVRDPVLSTLCLLGSSAHLLIILMMVGLVEFPLTGRGHG